MGSGSSLLSCGVFLPPPLSQAFPLLVAGHVPGSHQSLSGQAQLVCLQFREGFPSPSLQRSVHPILFPTCLYCSHCLLLSFSFFPGWRLVCPGGNAALAQGCLWEYYSTTKLTWSVSSQAIWMWASAGPGALLVSPLTWSGDALIKVEIIRKRKELFIHSFTHPLISWIAGYAYMHEPCLSLILGWEFLPGACLLRTWNNEQITKQTRKKIFLSQPKFYIGRVLSSC
jgi:hypothetical protein